MSSPFSYFGAPSEEQLEQMQLAGESFTRQIFGFLTTDLNKDQLFTMMAVLGLVNKSPRTNGYFSGLVSGALSSRFDICMCRGQDISHEHTLASHFDMDEAEQSKQASTAPDGGPLPGDSEQPLAPGEQGYPEINEPADLTRTLSPEEILDLEEVYKLDHSDVEGDTKVQCRKCGMEYPSIEDRMLRGVDECTGCEQAEKNGNWLNRWA